MTNRPAVDKLLYTPVEAARALGVSRSRVYVLMARGHVPSVRIGASRRIPAEGLRRYVEQLAGGKSASSAPTATMCATQQPPLWH